MEYMYLIYKEYCDDLIHKCNEYHSAEMSRVIQIEKKAQDSGDVETPVSYYVY